MKTFLSIQSYPYGRFPEEIRMFCEVNTGPDLKEKNLPDRQLKTAVWFSSVFTSGTNTEVAL
jgi:hypothetical protein